MEDRVKGHLRGAWGVIQDSRIFEYCLLGLYRAKHTILLEVISIEMLKSQKFFCKEVEDADGAIETVCR